MIILHAPFGALATNCYLVGHEGGPALVIDPGHGAAEPILAAAREHHMTITHILATHGHLDHTRDAGILTQALGLPLHLHTSDQFMLEDTQNLFSGVAMALDRAHMRQPDAVVSYDLPISPEDNGGFPQVVVAAQTTLTTEVGELTITGAPGHSPGHVLIQLDNHLFGGDVLFQAGIGRTDLPASNPETMMATLKETILTLPDGVEVHPGHGGATTIGYERTNNPFLRGIR